MIISFQKISIFILTFLISINLFAKDQNFEKFKKRIQNQIVRGMNIANSSQYIDYGEHAENNEEIMGDLDWDYWEKTGHYSFKILPGVNASEAIESVFDPMVDILLECHTMLIFTYYRAILKGIGEKKFNQLYNNNLIIVSGDIKKSGLEDLLIHGIKKEEIQLGDWVYFENHSDYLFKHPEGPWQGENSLAVKINSQGENTYSGFGASDLTESEMISSLMDEFNAPQSWYDRQIINKEWRNSEARKWLNKRQNAFRQESKEDRKNKYYQLKNEKFIGFDSEFDSIDEYYEQIALEMGYFSLEEFRGEFDYGVDEAEGFHIFWLQKVNRYKNKIKKSEVPGIVRVDRLNFEKVYELKNQ